MNSENGAARASVRLADTDDLCQRFDRGVEAQQGIRDLRRDVVVVSGLADIGGRVRELCLDDGMESGIAHERTLSAVCS